MRRSAVIVFAMAVGLLPASSQTTGIPSVLSSDTIAINGQIHRLFGIDGLELHQFCFVDGQPWACGAAATRALQTLLDIERVTCTPTGEPGAPEVRSVCTISLGDVAGIMIDRGWAVADPAQSDRYEARQGAAREARAGAWQGLFVEPWVYREDMLAIEDRYVARIADAMLADANEILADERGGIAIFEGFGVTRSAAAAEQEVRVVFPATGDLINGISAGETFSWQLAAGVMDRWRVGSQGRLLQALRNAQWTELAARPQTTVEVGDAVQFFAAIKQQSAGWVAAGRQPLLFVPGTDNPSWMAAWFGGTPPEGAVITRDAGIASSSYLGTIDGIHVYAGIALAAFNDETPNEALLVPSDLLQQVAYGTLQNGGPVTLDRDTTVEPKDLVFRYARSMTWGADRVVRLLYPYEGRDAFYAE